MNKLDLHTHSWRSDGCLSPAKLVEEAAELGLHTIALTDHDGTDGIEEAQAAGRRLGVCVIGGVEFSAFLDTADCTMHILGLGIDPQEQDMREKMVWIRNARRERNRQMLAMFHEMGFELKPEDLMVYPGQDYIGKPNIARALVNQGHAATTEEVFRSERMMASPKMKVVRRDRVAAEEAIRLIHGAGGVAVLAHPYKVFWKDRISPSRRDFDDPVHAVYREKMTAILDKLTALGLDGLECFYSSHSRLETEFLWTLAKERGLMVTAGSDYHGREMRETVALAGCWRGWEREALPEAVEAARKATELILTKDPGTRPEENK